MRLGHYEGLTLSLPSTTPTPASILALRHKLKETRKLNLALRSTHARNATTIARLQSLLSSPIAKTDAQSPPPSSDPSLAFLTSHPSATTLNLSLVQTSSPNFTKAKDKSYNPLETNTQFFISQLPALRSALEELKPRLKSLPEKIGDVDWESRREERRAYIEGRVRNVVDGMGIGGGGGDAMKGVRVGREEVRDLEGVVGGMGSDRTEE